MAHLIIIGAGIIGAAAAAHAIDAGFHVTLIDKAHCAGAGTSHANNALLTTSFATPFAAPGALKIALKSLLANPSKNPITAKLSAMPAQSLWALQFFTAARPTPYAKTSRTTLALARESLQLLHESAARRQIAFNHRQAGTLKIFHQQTEIQAFAGQHQLLTQLGIPSTWLTAAELLKQHPYLAGSRRPLRGGWYFPEDETGDCLAYLTALIANLEQQGLETRYNTAVENLVIENGRCTGIITGSGETLRADAVIAATGFVPAFAKKYIPVRTAPIKGHSFTFDIAGVPESSIPTAAVFDDTAHIGAVRLGQKLRLAGRADSAGFDLSLNPKAEAQVLSAFASLFPALAHLEPQERWCGLRPVTPTGLPFTGKTKLNGLYASLGHAHLGWTLAHASAASLIQQLQQNQHQCTA